jgi:C4-dicarboxylate-specific signal transduction histidine kinase
VFEDDGPGISEKDLASIFNPFFTTRRGGVGLGLAVSYKIVRDQGGEIHVENRTGGGCIFTVILQTGGAGTRGEGG